MAYHEVTAFHVTTPGQACGCNIRTRRRVPPS